MPLAGHPLAMMMTEERMSVWQTAGSLTVACLLIGLLTFRNDVVIQPALQFASSNTGNQSSVMQEYRAIPGKKVALLFLTYRDHKHPHIWDQFFDDRYYTIYVHPKFPKNVSSSPLKGHVIDKMVPTTHGTISLVTATLNLVEAALRDESNYKFVLLSDKCIPVQGSEYVYDFLTADDQAYLAWRRNLYGKDRNDTYIQHEFRRYDSLDNGPAFVDTNQWAKSSQWLTLNRELAEFAVKHRDVLDRHFSHFKFAADEHFFVNLFLVNNMTFTNRALTYVDWTKRKDNKDRWGLPNTINRLDCDEVYGMRKSGYLFARKFPETAQLPINCLLSDPGVEIKKHEADEHNRNL